jgi:hypothetical protein
MMAHVTPFRRSLPASPPPQVLAIEQSIGSGQVEELIEQAKSELFLIPK